MSRREIKKFTKEEIEWMYQILYEIHSGLCDKQLYSGAKLSFVELAWKISIEKLFDEMDSEKVKEV